VSKSERVAWHAMTKEYFLQRRTLGESYVHECGLAVAARVLAVCHSFSSVRPYLDHSTS